LRGLTVNHVEVAPQQLKPSTPLNLMSPMSLIVYGNKYVLVSPKRTNSTYQVMQSAEMVHEHKKTFAMNWDSAIRLAVQENV